MSESEIPLAGHMKASNSCKIQVLKRLESNSDKFLSSEQLFSSLRRAVINNSPTDQIHQYGEIREAGDEGGDFIFARRKNIIS
ncbi:MAG: hypothetical protein MUP22_04465 [Desulfobacterales bacterium]|nr:hypothetical protein [Desulfobacterales bacterium]